MKRMLKEVSNSLHYFVRGKRIEGKNPKMSGNCSGLFGNCTGLSGNCTGLFGNCSGLEGDCTGLLGDCTWLSGDINECAITDTARKKRIKIKDLIKSDVGK